MPRLEALGTSTHVYQPQASVGHVCYVRHDRATTSVRYYVPILCTITAFYWFAYALVLAKRSST